MENRPTDELCRVCEELADDLGEVSRWDCWAALTSLRAARVPVQSGLPDKPRGKLAAIVRAMVDFRDGVDADGDETARERSARDEAGPPDWRLYSHALLSQGFEADRERILAVFGRDEPLGSWTDVAPLIEALAETQVREGFTLPLKYPARGAAGERVSHQVLAWSGLDKPFAPDALGRAVVDLDLPVAPLFRLAETARRIEVRTCLPQSVAVSWLLTDEDVSLPWIRSSVRLHGPSRGLSFVIEVGTPAVRPDEVRSAYERLLSDTRQNEREIQEIGRRRHVRPYVRGRTHNKTAEMVDFVSAYRRERKITGAMPQGEWQKVLDAFSDAHPEYEPYGGKESIRVAFTRAVKRGGAER